MTKKQIEKLNTRQKEIHKLDNKIEKLKKERKHIQTKVFDIYSKCDHTYPDGRSAITGGFIYDYCSICNDMF